MRPQQITYDVCRLYLLDLQKHLPSESEVQQLVSFALGLLRARDLAGLTSLSKRVGLAQSSALVTRTVLQIEAFFKKNSAFSDDERCLENARLSFEAGERSCRIANRRLDWYYLHPERLAPDMQFYLPKMEKWISSVLGEFQPFLEEIPRLVRVTDGATASTARRKSLPFMKIKRTYDCPSSTVPYLTALAAFFGYSFVRCKTTAVNRVEVVPKNWQTFRTIACEPEGSLPFQLAFDTYGKRRLNRVKIDLTDQSRNQRLAFAGSLSDNIATVDLKNASNSVCYNAVAWLFPEPWFRYLCAHRSSMYKGPFGEGKYAMFSSMGNGATFCIETLIFAAACHAIGSRIFSVYGDDIIVESELYPKLVRVLRFLGFVINQDKSYVHGNFRESCGSHWCLGESVTPFYVRDVTTRKSDLSHLVNGLAEIAIPRGALWEYLLDLVKEEKLHLVPFNESSTSGVFILPQAALQTKLICPKRRQYQWIPVYKAYVSKTRYLKVVDSRTLFLWHHDAYRVRHPQDVSENRRSRVALSTHKYVRKWVCWVPPARPLPVHIYMWTEDLVGL